MTIEELFGTLQQATVASWRNHLRTAKYAKHEALDEFYKELPEKVDALIEGYMGAHGKKITKFENILKSSNMNTLKYLQELKKICKQGYGLLDENEELKGLLDDIVNLINSTLYKVKELAENHSYPDLADYINEALVNEAQAKGLTVSLKKDIDSYLRGMNTSDLKVLRDGWKEGDGNAAYDKMMHEMDMYLFGGVPGQLDRYKKIISSYIYGKILDRVGVNEAIILEAKNCFGDVAQFVAGGAMEPDVMDEKTFLKSFDWKKLVKKSNSKYDGDHLGYFGPLNHLKDEINNLSTYLFSLDFTDYESAEEFAEYINTEIADCLKSELTATCVWNMRDILVLFWKDSKAVVRLVFRPKR